MEEKKIDLGKIFIFSLIALFSFVAIYMFVFRNRRLNSDDKLNNDNVLEDYLSYKIDDNDIGMFDLYFLKLDNSSINKVYSPLSIKYSLMMLMEGTNGSSRSQISDIVGGYSPRKYINNSNMSFANAIFVKDRYKSLIKDSYVANLNDKYNASVVYDSFSSSNNVNLWINSKTLGLIPNMINNVQDVRYLLVNALGIDMEWVNKIYEKPYFINFPNTNFFNRTSLDKYTPINFNNVDGYLSVPFSATVNKYDIVSALGEDKIRGEVRDAYLKWLNDDKSNFCNDRENELDVDSFLDKYIDELNSNYKHVSASTDFRLFDNDEVIAFSKNLKKYGDIQLEYISIMPKNIDLKEYVQNVTSNDINFVIQNLKDVTCDNFKDGVVTKINGAIPLIDFDYSINLVNSLKKLGITDVFNKNRADLSNMLTDSGNITDVIHKARINLSNEGIKAAAATSSGDYGAGSCGFEYNYDLLVDEVNLYFKKPYMFLIRDNVSGEVWFSGTVYDPLRYDDYVFYDYN